MPRDDYYDRFSNSRGLGLTPATVHLIATLDAIADDPDAPHAAVYRVEDEAVLRRIGRMAETLTSVAQMSDGHCAYLSEWGNVHYETSLDDAPEEIGQPVPGPLKCLREIGGTLHASGFGGGVFRRRASGGWDAIGPGRALLGQFSHPHFECIDGFGPDELYATSYEGVLWWYDGRDWTPVECPTNRNFYALTCASDGRVYACGQVGVLAVGRRDEFELYDLPMVTADLEAVAWFEGSAYLATTRVLLRLDGEAVEPLTEPLALASTYGNLNVHGDVLWSIGAKDVILLQDKVWRPLSDISEVV